MTAHKPPRYTKAEQKAFKEWEKAHPFTNKPPRTARQPAGKGGTTAHGGGGRHGHGKHGHGKGKHGLALPGTADSPLCAATAVAVSLLLATGVRASDDDIAALHTAAGGDGGGAALEDVHTAVLRRGLAGMRLASAVPAPAGEGTLVSVALETAQADQGTWEDEPSPLWGLHAAVLSDGYALTWGQVIPVGASFLDRQVLGAWTLTWA